MAIVREHQTKVDIRTGEALGPPVAEEAKPDIFRSRPEAAKHTPDAAHVKPIQKVARWYHGGLASAMAACCTHPLDLLKVGEH